MSEREREREGEKPQQPPVALSQCVSSVVDWFNQCEHVCINVFVCVSVWVFVTSL